MTPLRIMVSRHSAFYSPVLCAIGGGFLEKAGFAPSYAVATPTYSVADAIAEHRADVVQGAPSYNWLLLEQGASAPPMLNFAQINQYDGFFIAARRHDGEFDWAALESQSLMFVHGGQPQAMLRYAMHLRGIDLARIAGIDRGGTDDMIAAFRAGEAAFFHEQGPYPHQLEHDAQARVVASVGEVIGPVCFSTLAATRDWLAKPDALRFMRAYRAARAFAHSAPAEQIAKIEQRFFPNIAREALQRAIAAYQALGAWAGEVAISEPLYDKALDVFGHAKLISRRYPFRSVVVPPPDGDDTR